MFPGNQWKKPLGEDELRILWRVLRWMSFQYDFLSVFIPFKARAAIVEGLAAAYELQTPYRGTEEPVSQFMRPLVNYLTLIKFVVSVVLTVHYIIPFLFWSAIELVVSFFY